MGENSGINRGLVNALNSVGQNLFGETVFSAGIIDPEIIVNPEVNPGVNFGMGYYPTIPNAPAAFFSVFRGDLCETFISAWCKTALGRNRLSSSVS